MKPKLDEVIQGRIGGVDLRYYPLRGEVYRYSTRPNRYWRNPGWNKYTGVNLRGFMEAYLPLGGTSRKVPLSEVAYLLVAQKRGESAYRKAETLLKTHTVTSRDGNRTNLVWANLRTVPRKDSPDKERKATKRMKDKPPYSLHMNRRGEWYVETPEGRLVGFPSPEEAAKALSEYLRPSRVKQGLRLLGIVG